jgi:hypothetical protein
MDYISRGYHPNTNSANFISNSANESLEFTQEERDMLSNANREVDTYIKSNDGNMRYFLRNTTNLDNLAKIPWKFAKISKNYENGMPHTRNGIIFLPGTGNNTSDLAKVLLHEKIHLFTKAYPDETNDIIASHGFVKVPRTSFSLQFHRSNPDISKDAYFNAEMGKIFVSQYESSYPHNISNTKSSEVHEHPYEWLAYNVSETARL